MKIIKKYYPLIVGLVLLISVAAYGTRAYFSDSTSQEAGIELTLGNVHVTGSSNEWFYNIEQGDHINHDLSVEGKAEKDDTKSKIDVKAVNEKLDKFVDIKNARPGDSFKKTFTFTNKGTLSQNLTFKSINRNKGYGNNSIFDIKWVDESNTSVFNNDDINDYTVTLEKEDSITATMIVTVANQDGGNYSTDGSTANTIVSTDINSNRFIGETVEATAEQTEATE